MSGDGSALCTSSSRLAVTLGRLELLSVWEGEQLQQLDWCRLLQSCCRAAAAAGTCRAACLKGRDLGICRQGGISLSWPL